MLHPLIKCGLQSAILIAPIKLKFKHWNGVEKPVAPSVLGHFIGCSFIEYTSILAQNYESHSSEIVNTGVTVAGTIKTSIIAKQTVTDPYLLASGILNAFSYYYRPQLKSSNTANETSFTDNLLFKASPIAIEATCNTIVSKSISQGLEAGLYLSFPLFPIYYAAVEYLETTSFGGYTPESDPITQTLLYLAKQPFTENVKICTLQSAAIIAPVFTAVTVGVEVRLKNNHNPKDVSYTTSLNVAVNSAAHFTKCMAVLYAKPASNSPEYHTALDTVAGGAKYAMVDYLHPDKAISIARIISGSWNGFGYNKAHLIDNNFNMSLQVTPPVIEAVDCITVESVNYVDSIDGSTLIPDPIKAAEEILKQQNDVDLTLPAKIGLYAGSLVALSIEYLYIPALEYINSETETSGNITAHEEL